MRGKYDPEEEEPRIRGPDDGPIRIFHTTAASQFLYGRSVVEAALKNSRRQLYKLYIYSGNDRQNPSQDDALAKLAREKGVSVEKVPNHGLQMMDKMSGNRPHNGCVLEASPLPQLPLKALGPLSEDPKKPGFHVEIAHQSSEEEKVNGTSSFVGYQLPKGRNPFVLLLDGILDPGNLGAILRTAAFLGVNGVGITKGSSATLTAVALKASAGASETSTLFSVNSAADFLARSRENGWLAYAAVPSAKRSRRNSHLTVDRLETYDPLSLQPTVLVVGSEGEGLAKPVRRQADHEVSIPSPSGSFTIDSIDSLNVSVATGILCSAFLRKQSSGMIEIKEDVSEDVSEFEDERESRLW
ncbi:Alpha/beta knot methyltransferase [Xylaria sp. FL1777]|nr:Alpha/beta knot methyltransferase [Xylaria sp. FL1777]